MNCHWHQRPTASGPTASLPSVSERGHTMRTSNMSWCGVAAVDMIAHLRLGMHDINADLLMKRTVGMLSIVPMPMHQFTRSLSGRPAYL